MRIRHGQLGFTGNMCYAELPRTLYKKYIVIGFGIFTLEFFTSVEEGSFDKRYG